MYSQWNLNGQAERKANDDMIIKARQVPNATKQPLKPPLDETLLLCNYPAHL